MIRIPRSVADQAERSLIDEGHALIKILSASESQEEVLVRYQILQHTSSAMNGVVSVEKFGLAGKAFEKLAGLFKRLGIVNRGEPSDDDELYDPEDLVGREVITQIAQKELQGKSGPYTISQWVWGEYYDPADARVGVIAAALGANQPRRANDTASVAALRDKFRDQEAKLAETRQHADNASRHLQEVGSFDDEAI